MFCLNSEQFFFSFMIFVSDDVARDCWSFFFLQVSKAPSVPINQPHSTARSDKSVFQLFLCGFVQFLKISWAKWLQLTRYSHWGFMDLESTGLASIFHSRKETRKFRCCLPSRVVGNSQSWQCGCRDTDVKQNGVNWTDVRSNIELHRTPFTQLSSNFFNHFYVSIVKCYVLFIWGHGSLGCSVSSGLQPAFKSQPQLIDKRQLCYVYPTQYHGSSCMSEDI